MRILHAFAILAGTALSSHGARAQTAAAPAAVPEAAKPEMAVPAPIDCGSKAALYHAGKSPKIWVMRQGTMTLAENPLRPLSRDEAVVLDVVVNGRRATAFGLDLNHLRQGGTPKSVEREGRGPIRWADNGVAPPAIRVVADDGRVLLGPMPFGGCEDAPAAKAVADKPVPAEKPAKAKRKGQAAVPAPEPSMPAHLPQGAIEGPTLSKGKR